MHIINFDNYQISLTEEALLIKPIRDLWNADKSKTKEKFMQQASVIYFYADPRSSYSYITDDQERLNEIIAQEGLPSDFTINSQLQSAIDCYKKHVITSSYKLLQSTKVAVDKVSSFLENVDLNERDDKGKLVYTISSITQAIKQIPQLSKDLVEAERVVTKEIEEAGRARGGNSKTLFEDGFDYGSN